MMVKMNRRILVFENGDLLNSKTVSGIIGNSALEN